MNGFRVARKYIRQLSDEDLHGIWNLAKDDQDYESIIITHQIECEIGERKMKDITKALRELGVKGTVTTKLVDLDRIAVYVNGEYFGLWDTTRKTFVD